MKAATLFSGIGAPEVAMPGWDWLWHAEIDPFASAVMAARHPQSINLGDVTAPDFVERALDAGRPDVVVFGSPCQSFSVAGKRLGLDDPRGNLALVALRILQRVRPRWLCFENVPGLLSSADGADFGAFLRAVAECGYLGCWRILDAQFAGVPQRRRRVFFVGHLGDWRPAGAVLFEPASLYGHPPPSRETWQGVARPVAASAPGGSGYRDDADTADNLVAATITSGFAKHRGAGTGDDGQHDNLIAGTLNSSIGRGTGGAHEVDFLSVAYGDNRQSGPLDVATAVNAHGEDGTGRGTPLVAQTVALRGRDGGGTAELGGDQATALRASQGGGDKPHVLAYQCQGTNVGEAGTLRSGNGHLTGGGPFVVRTSNTGSNGHGIAEHVSHTLDGRQQALAFAENSRAELRLEGGDGLTVSALKTGGGKPGQSYPAIAGTALRRLTVEECEALQGLPRGFTAIQWRGKPSADGPRYRAIGNSMAVPVVRWLLSRLEREHER